MTSTAILPTSLAQLIESSLPQREPVRLRCEADFYGASHLVASRLGRNRAPRSRVGWLHGWVCEPVSHPRQLLGNHDADRHMLVTTRRQSDFLNAEGYRASAVGLPFLYTTRPNVQRIKDSMLVMPAHTTKDSSHHVNEREYVDFIAQFRDSYQHIAVCVSQQCIDKGYWVESFRAAGITVIAGAGIDDRNALSRMRSLFHQFETVTSNAVGSHFVYAAYSECRVSLSGPVHGLCKADMANEPLYKNYPELVEPTIRRYSRESIGQHYPHLLCSPDQAKTNQAWAAREAGADVQLSDQELASLLRWGWWQRSEDKMNHLFRKAIKQKQRLQSAA